MNERRAACLENGNRNISLIEAFKKERERINRLTRPIRGYDVVYNVQCTLMYNIELTSCRPCMRQT